VDEGLEVSVAGPCCSGRDSDAAAEEPAGGPPLLPWAVVAPEATQGPPLVGAAAASPPSLAAGCSGGSGPTHAVAAEELGALLGVGVPAALALDAVGPSVGRGATRVVAALSDEVGATGEVELLCEAQQGWPPPCGVWQGGG